MLLFTLAFSIQDAQATNYDLKGKASCQEMSGTWNPIFMTCAIDGLQLYSNDKLVIGFGMHLENIGIITNNGGAIYNYGTIMTDQFSVIYNNYGGNIYNNGTVTNSGGTINNYASIHNFDGTIDNYGTVYNYNAIYNNNGSTIDDKYGVIYNNNGSTIDDKYGVIYNNNGTIYNDCNSIFNGNAPYGTQVRNVCSAVQPSLLLPLPPLQQLRNGTPMQKIVCNTSFVLIIKAQDATPACVRPDTAKILTERGWAR